MYQYKFLFEILLYLLCVYLDITLRLGSLAKQLYSEVPLSRYVKNSHLLEGTEPEYPERNLKAHENQLTNVGTF